MASQYRKKRRSDTWHFCSNCSNWPQSPYNVWMGSGTPSELCEECRSKRRNGNCS
jgi:hypothetical protein